MVLNKSICIVVPCYNESKQIIRVLETMPTFVDHVVVVDDCSNDDTVDKVTSYSSNEYNLTLEKHSKNLGVGSAIHTGYTTALDLKMDIVAVMAGDAQMDPADLESLIMPVAHEITDYCKGNRFKYEGGLGLIPKSRLIGNFVLSVLTKFVTGYWHVSDSQTGYTAINQKGLSHIVKSGIYESYGCPNDILVTLNIAEMRVAEVPVNPLYGVGEVSSMKISRIIFPISFLLFRLFIKRMVYKYMIATSHPLVVSYFLSLMCGLSSILLFVYCSYFSIINGVIPKPSLIVSSISLVLSIQFLLSSMEMDFSFNRHLCVTNLDGKKSNNT